MVIAVCAFGLALHPERGRVGACIGSAGPTPTRADAARRAAARPPGGGGVGACIGSAGPTPIRAEEAERFVQGVIEEGGLWESRAAIPAAALRRFGELVAGAAGPLGDGRGAAG